MSEEKEMTQEEMEKDAQKRKEDWESFMKNLNENPDEPVTKKDLLKIIDFVSNDVGGLAQIVQITAHNQNILNHNMQGIMQVLRGGPGSMGGASKTPGGIILP
jgi:hypothetical protein